MGWDGDGDGIRRKEEKVEKKEEGEKEESRKEGFCIRGGEERWMMV